MTTREALNTLREVFEQSPVDLGRGLVRNRLDAPILANLAYLAGGGITVAIIEDHFRGWFFLIPAILVVVVASVIEWATKGTVPASKVPELELQWLSRKADEIDSAERVERALHVNHDGTLSWIAGRADPDPYYKSEKKRRVDFEPTDFEAQRARTSRAINQSWLMPPAIIGCAHKNHRQEGYGVSVNYYCEDCGSRIRYPYGSSAR